MITTIENISIYAPGADVTAQATAAVTAKRFVAVAGNSAAGGNIAVAPAAAAGRPFGVAANTAAAGQLVRVVRGASRIVRVTSSGAIAANAEVEVGANGTVTTLAAGRAVGYAVAGALDATDAQISLYA